MPISKEEFDKLPSKTDEQSVREILEKEFNISSSKKKIKIGNMSHEFDMYSAEKKIVGEIKSGKDLDNLGKIKPYRFAEICLDCLYLMSIDSHKRILVLVHREMYNSFTMMIEGLPIKGIDIRLVELENPQFKGRRTHGD